MNDLKTIALKLDLPETATEEQILHEISVLNGYKSENVTLKNGKGNTGAGEHQPDGRRSNRGA